MLSSEGISEHSGFRRSRASSEAWVGRAWPNDSASNLLCATLASDQFWSGSQSLNFCICKMGTLLGPCWVDKHNPQTAQHNSAPKSPPLLFSWQPQGEWQCVDVWWGGPLLLQGKAQLDTSVPNRKLANNCGPVSLFLWMPPQVTPPHLYIDTCRHANACTDTWSHTEICSTHKATHINTHRHI